MELVKWVRIAKPSPSNTIWFPRILSTAHTRASHSPQISASGIELHTTGILHAPTSPPISFLTTKPALPLLPCTKLLKLILNKPLGGGSQNTHQASKGLGASPPSPQEVQRLAIDAWRNGELPFNNQIFLVTSITARVSFSNLKDSVSNNNLFLPHSDTNVVG